MRSLPKFLKPKSLPAPSIKTLLLLLIVTVGQANRTLHAQVSYAGEWPSTWDIAAGPSIVHANAGAGNCGCFFMNGAFIQFSITRGSGLGTLVDYGTDSITNINGSSHNILLSTYMAGARYRLHPRKRLVPYGHLLAGVSHASTNFRADNGALNLAYAGGGGIDYSVTRRISLRLLQGEYLITHVPNGINDRQNQLRLSIGIVFHLYRPGF